MRWNLFRSRRTRKLRSAHAHTRPCRLALEELEDRRLLATFNWVNISSGNFNTNTNWMNTSTGLPGVPGPTDDAIISVAGINVNSTASIALNSLACSPQ